VTVARRQERRAAGQPDEPGRHDHHATGKPAASLSFGLADDMLVDVLNNRVAARAGRRVA
jgi:hypothetical protein